MLPYKGGSFVNVKLLAHIPDLGVDGKRRRFKVEPSSTKNGRGGDLDAQDSSTRRASASASSVTHEKRDDDANPGASHVGGHTRSRSGSVPITMAPPFLLNGHGSPWAPMSPGQVSPIRMGRPNYSATPPFHVARAHQYGEGLVSRSAGPALSPPHSTPYKHTHAGGSRQGPLESLSDPATQPGRHGRPPGLRSSATAASVPSMSSTLPSRAATPSSNYASLGAMDDVRSQRSLPPIATVGLEPLPKAAQTDSGGPATFNSSSHVANSHTLPPPLHSPFLSASSSGKQQMIPDFGGGAWFCGCESGFVESGCQIGLMGMMNLTPAEVTIDPWSDGRSASRETREMQDTIRVNAGSHRPPAGPRSSELDDSPMDKLSSSLECFPNRENDALCVLAYAGRLVDRGVDYAV